MSETRYVITKIERCNACARDKDENLGAIQLELKRNAQRMGHKCYLCGGAGGIRTDIDFENEATVKVIETIVLKMIKEERLKW